MNQARKNPIPTVDIIIEIGAKIVLIERKNPPHGWALPGGFVDAGEYLEEAAVREALEETGLNVKLKELLYVFSDPGRDPRQHTISVTYIATAEGEPVGQDDAKRAALFDPEKVDVALAFDHAEIIKCYLDYRTSGKKPAPQGFPGHE